MNIFTDGAREYGKYPLSVYGKKMLLVTTFLIPYALIQYYPLLYILEKDSRPFFDLCAAVGCLVFTAGVCAVAVRRQTLSVERVVRRIK